MSFFQELKRRNVFRVGIGYVVTAWLLLQVSDIVFPRIGLPDWAVTLVIALLAIGFVPALIFAWAFELTPEGIKREKEVDPDQSITPQTGRKLDRFIIVALSLVIVWFLIDDFYLRPQAPAATAGADTAPAKTAAAQADDATSIAVLPFVNMSADKDNEYFADGITEELLNVLVKVSALRVTSRTTAFAYKGKDLPVGEIAKELKVANIVEGSVRKAGDRVRITAQLINAKTDQHVWSETYERKLDDIFEIQEEISDNIVNALKIALNVDEKKALDHAGQPTHNTQAYEYYLQGRYAWRQRHEDNIRNAIRLFEKAIKLDPNFARAYEGLASAWGVLPAWSHVSRAETMPREKAAAKRALELDPTLSEARAIMAEVASFEHRWADAIGAYERAVHDDPRDPTLHQWYGELLAYMGFNARALDQMRIAYDLDPASPVINQSMAWIAIANRKPDLALKHADISKGLGMVERGIYYKTEALAQKGEWDAGLKALKTLGNLPAYAKSCYRARRDPSLNAKLRKELDRLLEDSPGATRDAGLVLCLADAGEADRAARLVSADVANDWSAAQVFFRNSEAGTALRRTTAFRQTLQDLGLLDYYRANGWPDLCHAKGEDDFECD